jgi:hypothetical protein
MAPLKDITIQEDLEVTCVIFTELIRIYQSNNDQNKSNALRRCQCRLNTPIFS